MANFAYNVEQMKHPLLNYVDLGRRRRAVVSNITPPPIEPPPNVVQGQPGSYRQSGFRKLRCRSWNSVRRWEKENELLFAMIEDESEWIATLFPNEVIAPEYFFFALEDGVLLCKLAELIQQHAETFCSERSMDCPKFVVKFHRRTRTRGQLGQFLARENVHMFLNWCRGHRIPEVILFESNDIVQTEELREGAREVVICLMEVARMAYKYGVKPPKLVVLETEIELEERAEEHRSGTDSPSSVDSGVDTENYLLDLRQRRDSVDGQHDAPSHGTRSERQVNGHAADATENLNQADTTPKSELDERVQTLVKEYDVGKIYRLKEGKYIILGRVMFVRMLNDHLLVRIGGGWDGLEHYLMTHSNTRSHSRQGTPEQVSSLAAQLRSGSPSPSPTAWEKLKEKVKKRKNRAASSPALNADHQLSENLSPLTSASPVSWTRRKDKAVRKTSKYHGDLSDEEEITEAIRRIESTVSKSINRDNSRPKSADFTALRNRLNIVQSKALPSNYNSTPMESSLERTETTSTVIESSVTYVNGEICDPGTSNSDGLLCNGDIKDEQEISSITSLEMPTTINSDVNTSIVSTNEAESTPAVTKEGDATPNKTSSTKKDSTKSASKSVTKTGKSPGTSKASSVQSKTTAAKSNKPSTKPSTASDSKRPSSSSTTSSQSTAAGKKGTSVTKTTTKTTESKATGKGGATKVTSTTTTTTVSKSSAADSAKKSPKPGSASSTSSDNSKTKASTAKSESSSAAKDKDADKSKSTKTTKSTTTATGPTKKLVAKDVPDGAAAKKQAPKQEPKKDAGAKAAKSPPKAATSSSQSSAAKKTPSSSSNDAKTKGKDDTLGKPAAQSKAASPKTKPSTPKTKSATPGTKANDTKPADTKAASAKPASAKPATAKPTSAKPASAKPASAKPASTKHPDSQTKTTTSKAASSDVKAKTPDDKTKPAAKTKEPPKTTKKAPTNEKAEGKAPVASAKRTAKPESAAKKTTKSDVSPAVAKTPPTKDVKKATKTDKKVTTTPKSKSTTDKGGKIESSPKVTEPMVDTIVKESDKESATEPAVVATIEKAPLEDISAIAAGEDISKESFAEQQIQETSDKTLIEDTPAIAHVEAASVSHTVEEQNLQANDVTSVANVSDTLEDIGKVAIEDAAVAQYEDDRMKILDQEAYDVKRPSNEGFIDSNVLTDDFSHVENDYDKNLDNDVKKPSNKEFIDTNVLTDDLSHVENDYDKNGESNLLPYYDENVSTPKEQSLADITEPSEVTVTKTFEEVISDEKSFEIQNFEKETVEKYVVNTVSSEVILDKMQASTDILDVADKHEPVPESDDLVLVNTVSLEQVDLDNMNDRIQTETTTVVKSEIVKSESELVVESVTETVVESSPEQFMKDLDLHENVESERSDVLSLETRVDSDKAGSSIDAFDNQKNIENTDKSNTSISSLSATPEPASCSIYTSEASDTDQYSDMTRDSDEGRIDEKRLAEISQDPSRTDEDILREGAMAPTPPLMLESDLSSIRDSIGKQGNEAELSGAFTSPPTTDTSLKEVDSDMRLEEQLELLEKDHQQYESYSMYSGTQGSSVGTSGSEMTSIDTKQEIIGDRQSQDEDENRATYSYSNFTELESTPEAFDRNVGHVEGAEEQLTKDQHEYSQSEQETFVIKKQEQLETFEKSTSDDMGDFEGNLQSGAVDLRGDEFAQLSGSSQVDMLGSGQTEDIYVDHQEEGRGLISESDASISKTGDVYETEQDDTRGGVVLDYDTTDMRQEHEQEGSEGQTFESERSFETEIHQENSEQIEKPGVENQTTGNSFEEIYVTDAKNLQSAIPMSLESQSFEEIKITPQNDGDDGSIQHAETKELESSGFEELNASAEQWKCEAPMQPIDTSGEWQKVEEGGTRAESASPPPAAGFTLVADADGTATEGQPQDQVDAYGKKVTIHPEFIHVEKSPIHSAPLASPDPESDEEQSDSEDEGRLSDEEIRVNINGVTGPAALESSGEIGGGYSQQYTYVKDELGDESKKDEGDLGLGTQTAETAIQSSDDYPVHTQGLDDPFKDNFSDDQKETDGSDTVVNQSTNEMQDAYVEEKVTPSDSSCDATVEAEHVRDDSRSATEDEREKQQGEGHEEGFHPGSNESNGYVVVDSTSALLDGQCGNGSVPTYEDTNKTETTQKDGDQSTGDHVSNAEISAALCEDDRNSNSPFHHIEYDALDECARNQAQGESTEFDSSIDADADALADNSSGCFGDNSTNDQEQGSLASSTQDNPESYQHYTYEKCTEDSDGNRQVVTHEYTEGDMMFAGFNNNQREDQLLADYHEGNHIFNGDDKQDGDHTIQESQHSVEYSETHYHHQDVLGSMPIEAGTMMDCQGDVSYTMSWEEKHTHQITTTHYAFDADGADETY